MGAWKSFGFDFLEYTDDSYLTEFVSGTERIAGDRVFLKLSPNNMESLHYKYFPTTCTFSNGLTGNDEKSALLFGGASCSNSFLDLSIAYMGNGEFRIEHLL